MRSVGSEARFVAIYKVSVSAAVTALVAITTAAPVAADPRAIDSGSAPEVAQVVANPAYNPAVYNSPFYNAPVTPPPPPAYSLFNAPVTPPPPPYSLYN